MYLSCIIVTRNFALSWGSSKQGKAALAEVGSKWVVASFLKSRFRSEDQRLLDLEIKSLLYKLVKIVQNVQF